MTLRTDGATLSLVPDPWRALRGPCWNPACGLASGHIFDPCMSDAEITARELAVFLIEPPRRDAIVEQGGRAAA